VDCYFPLRCHRVARIEPLDEGTEA
jgi:hypothetical protein